MSNEEKTGDFVPKSPAWTTGELGAARLQLEADIRTLLKDFRREFGLTPTSVDVDTFVEARASGVRFTHLGNVKVEVSL